jgi:TPP-dependent 2-oxoacid decarboxylase
MSVHYIYINRDLFRCLNTINPRKIEEIMPKREQVTVGTYLARRLIQAGVGHYFTVPGDFTLSLLDEFLLHDELNMISCCNELNAAYAADGYARATGGLAAVCTTYM